METVELCETSNRQAEAKVPSRNLSPFSQGRSARPRQTSRHALNQSPRTTRYARARGSVREWFGVTCGLTVRLSANGRAINPMPASPFTYSTTGEEIATARCAGLAMTELLFLVRECVAQ